MKFSATFATTIAILFAACHTPQTEFEKLTANRVCPFNGSDAVQATGTAVHETQVTAQHLPDRLLFHNVYTTDEADSLGRIAVIIFDYTEYDNEDSARKAVKTERTKVRAKKYQGLAGLGDEAFLDTDSITYYNFVVRRISKVISIRFSPIPCTSRRENFLAVANRLSSKL